MPVPTRPTNTCMWQVYPSKGGSSSPSPSLAFTTYFVVEGWVELKLVRGGGGAWVGGSKPWRTSTIGAPQHPHGRCPLESRSLLQVIRHLVMPPASTYRWYVRPPSSPRVGRLLAFRRDPPLRRNGPKAPPPGGGGGLLGVRLAVEEGFFGGLASRC